MQQLLSFNSEGVQFAWDQTSIGYAENCLRKYYYTMIEGWRYRGVNAHLLFGGAYATALEHYHKHVAGGMDREEATIEVVHEAMVATWFYDTCDECQGHGFTRVSAAQANADAPQYGGAITFAEDDCEKCETTGKLKTGKPWLSDHNTKTRENLIRTIVWYLEQFKEDSCATVILSDGTAAVEHSFALPVDNDIILTGHLDRLVTYADKIYIQDQKTTGSTITPRYFAQYTNDNQVYQYTYAGKIIFGLPVSGMMIDAAQIAVGFTRFERGFVFMDDSQLNEWYDNTMWHIQLAQRATRENYFPMNRTSCNDYGGCPFREVCNKSPRVREQFLKADFEKGRRWDPLERR